MVKIRVLRSDGKRQWWQEYNVEASKRDTVLDLLIKIRETQDHSLAFRYSCQMGSCGSCAMVINGKARLACQTRVAELGTDVIQVEPLHNYPVIKDLVVDLTDFIEKHRSVKPYIIRRNPEELEDGSMEFRVLPEELENFLQFTYCIMCGACLAACPTVALDPKFLGPQALAQAYRYIADPRDEGFEERVLILDNPHGVWRCHFAGACSDACPKGVDPAGAIQRLKHEIMKSKFIRKKKVGAPVATVTPPKQPIGEIPKPPAPDFPPPPDFKIETMKK